MITLLCVVLFRWVVAFCAIAMCLWRILKLWIPVCFMGLVAGWWIVVGELNDEGFCCNG